MQLRRITQRLRKLPRPIRVVLIAVLILAVLGPLYPIKTIVVPAWPLQVIDDSNQPIVGINVTEHWQHYLLENEGHEALLQTDEVGMVSFPERSIRASMLRRTYRATVKIAGEGFRGRWDRYGSVVVWGSRQHAIKTALYEPDTVPRETIVVPRLTYTYSSLTSNRNLWTEFGILSAE